jgi:hypothetical protein
MIRTKRRKNRNNSQWLTKNRPLSDYIQAIKSQFGEFSRVNTTFTREKNKIIVNFKAVPVVNKINITYQYPDGANNV